MMSSRQAANESDSDRFTRAGLSIDRQANRVSLQGKPVDLTLSRFNKVCCLALSPGQVKTHRQLMRTADLYVETNTIVAHVKTIGDRFLGLLTIHDTQRYLARMIRCGIP